MLSTQSKQFFTKRCLSTVLDTPRTKLKEWRYKFQKANIFEADISAEIIISHALGKKMVKTKYKFYQHSFLSVFL